VNENFAKLSPQTSTFALPPLIPATTPISLIPQQYEVNTPEANMDSDMLMALQLQEEERSSSQSQVTPQENVRRTDVVSTDEAQFQDHLSQYSPSDIEAMKVIIDAYTYLYVYIYYININT
jgi:hypothetical protein